MKKLLLPFLACFALGAANLSAITPSEAESILYIKQEEKLARDVYTVLHQTWSQPVFSNIAQSEQRHMYAVDNLIARYRLNDNTPAEPGKFSIPELQSLYEQLVAAGKQSLTEALLVGQLIEETDIDDLQAVLDTTREPAIRRVLGNLKQGSENHLSAFTGLLD